MQKHVHKKTFLEIFTFLKKRIANNKITLEEISKTLDIDEKLLLILFDDTNNVIKNIDTLLNCFKIKLYFRHNDFNIYATTKSTSKKNIIKIKQKLHPYAQAYFDYSTNKLYNFSSVTKIKTTVKQLIINDMYNYLEIK